MGVGSVRASRVSARPFRLFKEILIDPLDVQDLLISTTNIMPDHKVAKLLRINEDNTTADLSRRIHCAFREARGRNKYALLSLLQTQ
jgi:hypothetical protein